MILVNSASWEVAPHYPGYKKGLISPSRKHLPWFPSEQKPLSDQWVVMWACSFLLNVDMKSFKDGSWNCPRIRRLFFLLFPVRPSHCISECCVSLLVLSFHSWDRFHWNVGDFFLNIDMFHFCLFLFCNFFYIKLLNLPFVYLLQFQFMCISIQ